MRKSEKNSIALAKYLSTRINRPLISPTAVTRSQNNQVSTNLTRVSPAPETNFTTSENDKFHSNDYPKSLAEEKKNQDTDSDATLGTPKNSGETSDKAIPLSNNNESETRLAKDSDFDDENNDEELMPPLEKAKWVLADDPLEAMELYFESLGFQVVNSIG